MLAAIADVAKTAFKLAPWAVVVQVIGALITAILPLVTTYFAALTTTALAEAYAGKADAGNMAITYVLVTAILGITMTAWRSVERYLSEAMRYKVESSMTDRMYEHFLRLDFWRYDDKETADLYEKAKKFGQFFPYIFSRLSGMAASIIAMVSGIIALLFVSWWLSLLALAAIIPGLIIQLRLSRLQAEHWKQNITSRRTVSWIEWGMMRPDKIAELRLYGLVRYLLDLRQTMRDKDEKARIAFERSFIWKRLGASALESTAETIALVWVALQIVAKQQPIGQFLYVQQVVSRAMAGASSFVTDVNSLDEDLANLFDYQKFMALPESVHSGEPLATLPASISVNDVWFNYPSSKVDVLKGVSLTITRGRHIAVVGENGAGKTTLLKILTGLYQPSKGNITLDGTDLSTIDAGSWHKHLGMLGQDFIKYDFATARDNITYGDVSTPVSSTRLERAINVAEAGFLHKLPNGLNNYVDQWMEGENGEKGQELSGGQWQRLALARSFYRDAPIIILDEPTSAIDALAESRIFKHLFALEDKTIITVSHRLTTVEKADVVYMLKDGQIVEQGTAKQLIKNKGAFYEMFESQIK